MVTHVMGLFAEGFEMIKSGRKTVEIRLHDEKRKEIRVGDKVEFRLLPDKAQSLSVLVTKLQSFAGFKEAYEAIDFGKMGREEKTMQWMMDASYEYYTKQKEATYGILAIHFELIQ